MIYACSFNKVIILPCIKCNISLVLFSPGSVEADAGCGGKLNSHLMASCFRNICTKNRQNLLILSKVTIDNVRVPFWDTVYMYLPAIFRKNLLIQHLPAGMATVTSTIRLQLHRSVFYEVVPKLTAFWSFVQVSCTCHDGQHKTSHTFSWRIRCPRLISFWTIGKVNWFSDQRLMYCFLSIDYNHIPATIKTMSFLWLIPKEGSCNLLQ